MMKRPTNNFGRLLVLAGLPALLSVGSSKAQTEDPPEPAVILPQASSPAPVADVVSPVDRPGDGPFGQLILRGGILIDGTGAPPRGPVDIVLRGDRIEAVVPVGLPGAAIDSTRRPPLEEGGREIDVAGKYVLPGLIDLFGHVNAPDEYVMKLWLGHGITTVREPLCAVGIEACLRIKEGSSRNDFASPHFVPYLSIGLGLDRPLLTAKQARDWVAEAAQAGAAGIKIRSGSPEVVRAALAEAKAQGIGSACHLDPVTMAQVDLFEAAHWGCGFVEHGYGLPEILAGPGGQPLPAGYNGQDQQQRFARSGQLWRRTVEPGSEVWNEAVRRLADSGVTLVPTLSLYEANRDLMRASRAEWHELYTSPSLWRSFRPSAKAYASPWSRWTTEEEAAWRHAYNRWEAFLLDFKSHGGRVATGTDSGFLFNLHGFGLIRELELLREAGLTPMEVIQAATLHAAEALGMEALFGTVEPGRQADLVVVEEDPLADLKVLYGIGALRVDEQDRPIRVGGVELTIKGGIVFDAKQLLAEVRQLVGEAWEREDSRPGPLGLEAGAEPRGR